MARKSGKKIKMKSGSLVKTKPGKCSVCGKHELDYGSSIIEGENLGYEFSCKCGAYGIEWYSLVYAETLVKGKDKNMQLC